MKVTMQHPSVPLGFFIGAYAAAPSLDGWNPVAEGRFLESVLALERPDGTSTAQCQEGMTCRPQPR